MFVMHEARPVLIHCVWESVIVSRWSPAIPVFLASLGLGACSAAAAPAPHRPPTCSTFSGFESSLVSNQGGQPSPVRAAEWFAVHGGVANIPPSKKWSKLSQDNQGVTVYSGKTVLHILRGTDGTWLVDSGKQCS